MGASLGWWIGFNAVILVLLAMDLVLLHRKVRTPQFRESMLWVGFWTSLALIFCVGIYLGWFGEYEPAQRAKAATDFLQGYVVELMLSVDNVFVFAVVFTYFAVPPRLQHRVLFLGILGALVFRFIFIFLGAALIHHFEWTLLLFGLLLIYTGIKLVTSGEKEIDPERNPMVRLVRRFVPLTDGYRDERFFVRENGILLATPLLLVLVVVETTDIVFAVDSIPAILGITKDTFIVYTSNVFAILGLRALYFAVSGFMKMFAYLNYGLAVILVFIGGKMIAEVGGELLLGKHLRLESLHSLLVILGVLAISIAASLLFPKKHAEDTPAKT